jgi:purine-binding chemotaxis protein CheW
MVETRLLCTFWLDRLYFGVNVRDVQGVISHQPLTRVPLAPPAVRGLINLRGEVIAGIDLRPCLELEAKTGECTWTNIILKGSSGSVSLLVDRVGNIATVAEHQLEPPPETLPARIREITDRVCQIDGRLMLLLDVEAAIEMASGTEVEY